MPLAALETVIADGPYPCPDLYHDLYLYPCLIFLCHGPKHHDELETVISRMFDQ